MKCSQSLCSFVLFDDRGDIAFRRALRDCSDVDARFAESVEKLSGHAESFDHAVANHRDDATTLAQIDGLDLAALYFSEKRFLHGFSREFGLGAGNRKTD